MPRPSRLYYRSNNLWPAVQIKLSARNDICYIVLLLPYFLPFRRPYLPQQPLPNLPTLSSSLQALQPLHTASQI